MKKALIAFALFLGCDRGMIFTEQGLMAAELIWSNEYYRQLDQCKEKYEPKTQEAESCFGKMYDADVLVNVAIGQAVELLREYWALRALGQHPDASLVMLRVRKIVKGLPEEAQLVFNRVEGLR